MKSLEFISYFVTTLGIIGVLLCIQISLNQLKRKLSEEQNVWNKIYNHQEKPEEFEAIYLKPRHIDKKTVVNLNQKKLLRIKNSSLVQSMNQKPQDISQR